MSRRKAAPASPPSAIASWSVAHAFGWLENRHASVVDEDVDSATTHMGPQPSRQSTANHVRRRRSLSLETACPRAVSATTGRLSQMASLVPSSPRLGYRPADTSGSSGDDRYVCEHLIAGLESRARDAMSTSSKTALMAQSAADRRSRRARSPIWRTPTSNQAPSARAQLAILSHRHHDEGNLQRLTMRCGECFDDVARCRRSARS